MVTNKKAKRGKRPKKGKTFTKLSNAITIAVKQGGGVSDPSSNFKLRLAIDAARAANMPKDNIEKAIKRAAGIDASDISEVVYEGFAPGGVSVIVEAATDNSMRTTSEIKNIFNKSGASFGQPGSVSYQFKNAGRIILKKGTKTIDEIFEVAVSEGAEDVEEIGDEVFIYTKVSDLNKIKDRLLGIGVEVVEADLVREPLVKVSEEDEEKLSKIENFVNSLEELDDVQKVYTNLA